MHETQTALLWLRALLLCKRALKATTLNCRTFMFQYSVIPKNRQQEAPRNNACTLSKQISPLELAMVECLAKGGEHSPLFWIKNSLCSRGTKNT